MKLGKQIDEAYKSRWEKIKLGLGLAQDQTKSENMINDISFYT